MPISSAGYEPAVTIGETYEKDFDRGRDRRSPGRLLALERSHSARSGPAEGCAGHTQAGFREQVCAGAGGSTCRRARPNLCISTGGEWWFICRTSTPASPTRAVSLWTPSVKPDWSAGASLLFIMWRLSGKTQGHVISVELK